MFFCDFQHAVEIYSKLIEHNPEFALILKEKLDKNRKQTPELMKKYGEALYRDSEHYDGTWPWPEEKIEFYILKSSLKSAIRDYLEKIVVSRLNESKANMGFSENDRVLDNSAQFSVDGISFLGRDSFMYKLEKLEKAIKENNAKSYEEALAHLFYLDIGGEMKKYRQDFLTKLQAQGNPIAEERWQTVFNAIKTAERGGSIPEGLSDKFPRTFADALHFYAS